MLVFLKNTAKAVCAEKSGLFAAAFLIFAAALLHMPDALSLLLLLLILAWIVICALPHLPQISQIRQDAMEARAERDQIILRNDGIARENASLRNRLMASIVPSINAMLRGHGFRDVDWQFQREDAKDSLLQNQKVRLTLSGAGNFAYADLVYLESGNLLLEIIQPIQNGDMDQCAEQQSIQDDSSDTPVPDISPETDELPEEPEWDNSPALSKEPEEESAAGDSSHDEELVAWMKKNRMTLSDLCFDAFEKKLDAFVIKNDLPEKNLWPRLAVLMDGTGKYSSVKALEEGIKIRLKREQSLFA